MSNKSNLQKAIDKDINKEQIYNNIMRKAIKRKNPKPYWKWKVAFTCIFGFIFITLLSREKILKPITIDEKEPFLYINELDSEIINERDDTVKVPVTDSSSENLADIVLPFAFTEANKQVVAVYIQKMNNFDIEAVQPYSLSHYEVNYQSGNKELSLAFSETNNLLDDYVKEGNVTVIENTDVKIFHYSNTYLAYFECKRTYFKIETKGFTQEELLNLISSII